MIFHIFRLNLLKVRLAAHDITTKQRVSIRKSLTLSQFSLSKYFTAIVVIVCVVVHSLSAIVLSILVSILFPSATGFSFDLFYSVFIGICIFFSVLGYSAVLLVLVIGLFVIRVNDNLYVVKSTIVNLAFMPLILLLTVACVAVAIIGVTVYFQICVGAMIAIMHIETYTYVEYYFFY